MPDQPWTTWWEIDDAELAAARMPPNGASDPTPTVEESATQPTDAAPGDLLVAELGASGPDAGRDARDADRASEYESPAPPVFPDVDTVGRGGIQRVDTAPQRDRSQAPDKRDFTGQRAFGRLRPPPNPAVAETAATGAAGALGVQTVAGRFTVEGFARRPGDLVFTGITFSDPVATVPMPGAIQLTVDDTTNVESDGVALADLGGFSADRQGFTLITTAQGPGMVRAHGHYVVEL